MVFRLRFLRCFLYSLFVLASCSAYAVAPFSDSATLVYSGSLTPWSTAPAPYPGWPSSCPQSGGAFYSVCWLAGTDSRPSDSYVYHVYGCKPSSQGLAYSSHTVSSCVYGVPPPPDCSAKKDKAFTASQSGTLSVLPDYEVCVSSCLAHLRGIAYFDRSSGSWLSVAVYTGDVCTVSVKPDNSHTSPDACPAGQVSIGGHCYPTSGAGGAPACPAGSVSGEVNGKAVCVKSDSGPTVAPPPSPSGDTSGTPPPTATPGSNTGSCPADNPGCGAGSGSGSGYCDPAIDAHCSADGGPAAGGKNTGTCPKSSPGCGASSGSVAGKCDVSSDTSCSPSGFDGGLCTRDVVVPPACRGDAVQCAQALNSWFSQCSAQRAFDTSAAGNSADRAAVDGPVGDALAQTSGDSSGVKTLDIPLLTLDQAGYGAVASCPLPISVSALGHTWSLDLSPLCSLAGKVRPFFLLLCAFISGLIYLRGIVPARGK